MNDEGRMILDLEAMLRHGRGRAVLLLREQPDTTLHRNTVWGACSEYWYFDWQLEDERLPYLLDVIHATGEPGYYTARIAAALDTFGTPQEESTFYRTHLIRLAAHLTRNGASDLRESIYRAIPAVSGEAYGIANVAEEIIALDGVAGYWFLVEQLRHHPSRQDYHRAELTLLKKLSNRLGESVATARLDATAANVPERKRYLDEIRKIRRRQKARAKLKRKRKENAPPHTLANVRAYVNAPTKDTVPKPWMDRMNRTVRKRLISDLGTETDRARQLRYLNIVRTYPYEIFPGNPEIVLPLIRQTDDERVSRQAMRVLEDTSHPSIRVAALGMLTQKERMPHGIHLLVNNPGDGDIRLLENVLREEWDDRTFEFLCMGIRDYINRHASPANASLLLTCYERLACSFCRNHLVDMLVERNALPVALREECPYDADWDTRDLFRPGGTRE